MCASNEADSELSSFAIVILFRIVILSEAKDLCSDCHPVRIVILSAAKDLAQDDKAR